MAKLIPIIILTAITSARAWNFESIFEALTTDQQVGQQLCLGECMKGQCVYSWHGWESSCTKSKKRRKKYTTIDNEVCESNCDKYDRESYEWCVTGNNAWNECSRKIALKSQLRHTTKNKYVTCMYDNFVDPVNGCGKHDYSYDWCTTITGWEECNIDDKALVPEYPTTVETICETPCKFYDYNKAYCYDTKGNWVSCFLNPRNEYMLNNITQQLRKSCRFGVYAANGYKICKKVHKRSDYDNLHFHECDLDIESIAERHRLNNPSDEVRTILPSEPITRDTDPILSYTTLPRRGRFDPTNGDTTGDVDIPLVVQAQLTTYTLLPVGAPRAPFPLYVTNNYNRMNPNNRASRENYDERGHVVGSRLGGPMEMFNIFPQTWRLNHGRGSSWFEMEQHLDNFLRGHSNRYVEFLAVLGYLTDQSGTLIPRPDHIGIRLRFHVNNYLTDRHGNPLVSFEDNETENMFFSNDPDDDCIIAVANEFNM